MHIRAFDQEAEMKIIVTIDDALYEKALDSADLDIEDIPRRRSKRTR